MKLLYPVGTKWVISQSFDRHIQRAKENGWCSNPGTCYSGIYYYGGIDWACPNGTPVYAAADSISHIEVQNQGNDGYGLNIRIPHKNGWYTIYGHLQTNFVQNGADVKQGQLIGYTNDTGNSTGPHIHFELRINGIPTNPAPYLVESVDDMIVIIPPPVDIVIPIFPEPVMFKLREQWDYVNIRKEPWGDIIGKIDNYKPFPVYDALLLSNEEVWLNIGYNQYCAYRTVGNVQWTDIV